MKFQNWSKRIVPVLGVCGALTMAFMSNSKNISAANIVSSEKVFENVSAGAAQVLEFNTVPSEEEINDIFETNYSWKNEGALVMAEVSNSVNVEDYTIPYTHISESYLDEVNNYRFEKTLLEKNALSSK